MRRPIRSVRGDDKIDSRAAQSYQFAQGFDASSGTGSANRPKPEPFNDARNDLTVLMLTDQNMGERSPVGQRHHELTGMPEGDDDPLPFPVQPVDILMAACINPHGPSQCPNHRGTGRRKHGELHPTLHRFQPPATHSAHPGIEGHGAACSDRHAARAHHAYPFRRWCPDP